MTIEEQAKKLYKGMLEATDSIEYAMDFLQQARNDALDGLWDRYIHEVQQMYGKSTKPPVNFLGSVDNHRQCFEKALKTNE